MNVACEAGALFLWQDAGFHVFTMDPAEALSRVAADAGSHHPSLPCRCHGNPSAACGVLQDMNLRMLFEKLKVRSECRCGFGFDGRLFGCWWIGFFAGDQQARRGNQCEKLICFHVM